MQDSIQCLSLALVVCCFLFRCPGSLALKFNHDGNMTMDVNRYEYKEEKVREK